MRSRSVGGRIASVSVQSGRVRTRSGSIGAQSARVWTRSSRVGRTTGHRSFGSGLVRGSGRERRSGEQDRIRRVLQSPAPPSRTGSRPRGEAVWPPRWPRPLSETRTRRRRSRPSSCAIEGLSDDGGASWGKQWIQDALIEPPCQASIFRYTRYPEYGKNRLLFLTRQKNSWVSSGSGSLASE